MQRNDSLEDNLLIGCGVNNNGVVIPHNVGSTVETDIFAVFNQLGDNQTWMGFVRNDSMKRFCIIARSNNQKRGIAIAFATHNNVVTYYRFQNDAIVKNATLNMTDVTT